MAVLQPTSTTSHAGELNETPLYVSRYYYHEIVSQLGNVIAETGIPCDEDVEFKEGQKPWWIGERSWYTEDCEADGDFPGGIAVPDHLGCPAKWGYTWLTQQLTAGGCSTSPGYNIFFDPMGDERKVWKE